MTKPRLHLSAYQQDALAELARAAAAVHWRLFGQQEEPTKAQQQAFVDAVLRFEQINWGELYDKLHRTGANAESIPAPPLPSVPELQPLPYSRGRYLTATCVAGGLELRLTAEGWEEVASREKKSTPDHILFYALFEDFLGNGWSSLDAAQIGALTSCQIILSPDATFDDEGNIATLDVIYWHERYQVEDAIEALKRGKLFLIRQ